MHPKHLEIASFTYPLPEERIARYPISPRDASKLLVYNNGGITEDTYVNIAQHLPTGAMLVFNQTKVINARLLFKRYTGATIELFCLEPHRSYADVPTAMLRKGRVLWQCLVGGAKKWKDGVVLSNAYPDHGFVLSATLEARTGNIATIEFTWDNDTLTFAEVLHHAGEIPLPPYLKRQAETIDRTTYQTIYAREEGSVAAPTAGLHFTDAVMHSLAANSIATGYVTLHVGAGTFMPVKSDTMETHTMHAEWIEVTTELLQQLLQQLQGIIVAVGTTSLRTLESLYHIGNKLVQGIPINWQGIAVNQWDAYEGSHYCTPAEAIAALLQWMDTHQTQRLITRTQILIAPGYTFQVVKGLITNFHQPQSTLLLLIAALIGEDWQKVYQYALDHNYRFLSYGDGSLLWANERAIPTNGD